MVEGQNGVMEVVEDVVAAVVDKNEAKIDAIVDLVLKKITDLIPGKLDDAFAAEKSPEIKAYVKANLDKLVDKIDGQVG